MSERQNASTDSALSAPCESCVRCRDGAAARTERDLRVLDELAELGMVLARAITQQALAYADGRPVVVPLLGGGDPALALSRIARSVRQTLALKARLDEDRWERDKRREAERAAAAERERGRQKKAEVKRLVERVIETEVAETFRAENLLIDLHERLADKNDTAFGDIPIALVVAAICRDLPAYFDRSQWEEEIKVSEGVCAGEAAGASPPDAASAADEPIPIPRTADRCAEPPSPSAGRGPISDCDPADPAPS